MTIAAMECWVFRVPIESPVQTSFGVLTDRPAVFLRLTASDGAWGWGEVFSNFPQVGAEHRARLVHSLFAPLVVGAPSDDAATLSRQLEEKLRRVAIQCGEPGPFAQVIGATDQALWDLIARRAGQPLWRLLSDGPAGSPLVRVYASGLGPDDVAAHALAKQAEGYRGFKFKVGFTEQRDASNFQDIRAALGQDAVVMVDANQAWTPQTAAVRMAALAPFEPLWIEEPMAADEELADWCALAAGSKVSIAAGENLRGLGAFERAMTEGGVRYVQPDVAKWGGISGCREVARLAKRHGATFCPHWLGGGIGLAASLHLRAAMGAEGWAEVDANPNPLREQVCPVEVRDGWVRLSDRPGLGVEPDLARLSRYRSTY